MNDITVMLQDDSVCHFVGETILDASENVLIVHDDTGCSVTFYWPYVAFYIQTPVETEETE
ncbi:hypothetical protein ACWF99_23855 [Nocardia sp. NPDC055002]